MIQNVSRREQEVRLAGGALLVLVGVGGLAKRWFGGMVGGGLLALAAVLLTTGAIRY